MTTTAHDDNNSAVLQWMDGWMDGWREYQNGSYRIIMFLLCFVFSFFVYMLILSLLLLPSPVWIVQFSGCTDWEWQQHTTRTLEWVVITSASWERECAKRRRKDGIILNASPCIILSEITHFMSVYLYSREAWIFPCGNIRIYDYNIVYFPNKNRHSVDIRICNSDSIDFLI